MHRLGAMTTVEQSRAVAEESRQASWTGESFIHDLFLGRHRLDLIESLALTPPTRPEFWEFYDGFKLFLQDHVDPVRIDETGQYPPEVLSGLARLGAFGMKIPAAYGGLGLTHTEYVTVMELAGSHCGNTTALLSAHQAIGVPQPVMLFGTEEQKRRFLPRCAKGAISAFALTEPAVGSDPARLGTLGEWHEDGDTCVLNGVKLWCTNGTLAELIVVMARDPQTNRISAFVVDMDTPGVTVERRCHFMGLRALANALIRFDGARIPRENLIGQPGDGLRIALTTLNTGRLTLPAATAGMAKRCTEIVRRWSAARIQWGQPIGKHEAVAHLNADIVASTFAMDSMARAIGACADRPDLDIRLEAAAAKEWNTTRCWRLLDETLQVRGGRGYETERSLAARGEAPIGVERMLRDARINLIFEGSSEIMHLFMAREAVDYHLRVAGTLVKPKASSADKLRALPRIALHYAWWYPSRWLGWSSWPRYRGYGRLAKHLRFADRAARKLARSVFHGMLRFRGGLERRQQFLFRLVDIAMELFVLTTSVCRAQALQRVESDKGPTALELADVVARKCRRRVRQLFRELWRNDDARHYQLGRALLDGSYSWLEQGAMPLPLEAPEQLVPQSMEELLRRPPPAPPPSQAAPH